MLLSREVIVAKLKLFQKLQPPGYLCRWLPPLHQLNQGCLVNLQTEVSVIQVGPEMLDSKDGSQRFLTRVTVVSLTGVKRLVEVGYNTVTALLHV